MTETNERKSPEEIKTRILEVLNDKPLNAQEISKSICSNWSTVKTYVEELAREGKIKEISFRGNSFYQKIIEDTYFNIPIKEAEREKFKFIFYNAIKIYKERTGKQIRRTELAKLSAELNTDLKLNLPIVWYIYGPMPLMIIDFQKDYTPKRIPENAREIEKAIDNWIKNSVRDRISELKIEYYQKSKNAVYFLKESIYQNLEKGKYDSISNILFEFLSAVISYDKKFKELVYELYEIASASEYIKLFEKKEFQNKFLLAFDSLWKYLASNMIFESLIGLGYSKEETELLIGPTIETKNHFASENMSELKEYFLEHLPEKVPIPKFSEMTEEARRIIDQWTDSGVWRE